MDFSSEVMCQLGHGLYSHIKIAEEDFPKFFLAYVSDPSDSGKIHNDVYARWEQGDQEVVQGMARFAELTVQAKQAIESKNWANLADLMNHNFELRRSLYGEACLGERNLRMVEIGRNFGASCKFPGNIFQGKPVWSTQY